jgi:hypothetical protein
MTVTLEPTKSYTFTVTKEPQRDADRKTIERLMRMQPHIQNGLRALAKQRRQKDNRPYIRAGVIWVDRAKATKLARALPGESFTLRLTPQIIPDIQSVEQFLEIQPAE